jgi:hypothetical protein
MATLTTSSFSEDIEVFRASRRAMRRAISMWSAIMRSRSTSESVDVWA